MLEIVLLCYYIRLFCIITTLYKNKIKNFSTILQVLHSKLIILMAYFLFEIIFINNKSTEISTDFIFNKIEKKLKILCE